MKPKCHMDEVTGNTPSQFIAIWIWKESSFSFFILYFLISGGDCIKITNIHGTP